MSTKTRAVVAGDNLAAAVAVIELSKRNVDEIIWLTHNDSGLHDDRLIINDCDGSLAVTSMFAQQVGNSRSDNVGIRDLAREVAISVASNEYMSSIVNRTDALQFTNTQLCLGVLSRRTAKHWRDALGALSLPLSSNETTNLRFDKHAAVVQANVSLMRMQEVIDTAMNTAGERLSIRHELLKQVEEVDSDLCMKPLVVTTSYGRLTCDVCIDCSSNELTQELQTDEVANTVGSDLIAGHMPDLGATANGESLIMMRRGNAHAFFVHNNMCTYVAPQLEQYSDDTESQLERLRRSAFYLHEHSRNAVIGALSQTCRRLDRKRARDNGEGWYGQSEQVCTIADQNKVEAVSRHVLTVTGYSARAIGHVVNAVNRYCDALQFNAVADSVKAA